VLQEVAPIFLNPRFPRVYLQLQGKSENSEILIMEHLTEARTLPRVPGIKGERLLRLVDSLAEWQAYYMNDEMLARLNGKVVKTNDEAVLKGFSEIFGVAKAVFGQNY
jgi:hypothetical protein